MGYNGCGKSTLLKLLAKLVAATSGTVVYSRRLLFHYIPERFTPVSLTGRKYLIRMGALDGLKRSEVQDTIKTLGNDFFLTELLDTPMKFLSKGVNLLCPL